MDIELIKRGDGVKMLIEEVTEENVESLKDGELCDLTRRCGLVWQKIEGDKHEKDNQA